MYAVAPEITQQCCKVVSNGMQLVWFVCSCVIVKWLPRVACCLCGIEAFIASFLLLCVALYFKSLFPRVHCFAFSEVLQKGDYAETEEGVGVKLDDHPDGNGQVRVTMKGGANATIALYKLEKRTKEEYDECDEAWSRSTFH